jgi:hypothetical protein
MSTATKYDTRKALFDYYVYAPIGAGQLVAEKTKELSAKAMAMAKEPRITLVKAYRDLTERGEKLVKGMRSSSYTKRAIAQTKTAGTQVKAASTSIRKAARSSSVATKAAAKKVS